MNSTKFWLVIVTAMVVYLAAPLVSSATLPQGVPPPPLFVPDQVLVAFHPNTAASVMAQAHSSAGAAVTESLGAIGAQIVTVPPGTVLERVATYRSNPSVRYAEPNYLRPLILPDEGQDPPPSLGGLGIDYLAEQWALNNTGQPLVDPDTGAVGALNGTPDADIDAPEGWDVSMGSPAVTIAILDTGVECTHVDLMNKCVDVQNFSQSNTTDDLLGHGTHVAGIAAANTNNNVGVAGVGWNSSIASLKVCYEYPSESIPLFGLCTTAASAAAITHAADNGYQVISMSYGSDPNPYAPSQVEQDAVNYAWNQGVVLVAAAGNDYAPDKVYPAAFTNVIAVAASDWHDNLAYFSTFGPWVSVAAPGRNVFSTYPNAGCGLAANDPEGCYTWLSGTSMAAPHVAGLAALVWAAQPGVGAAGVRSAIESTADRTGALGQNFLAWTQHGRVNVFSALTGNGPPPSSINLTATGYKVKGLQKADLTWTGASAAVNISRDGVNIASGVTNGSYTDNIDLKGTGSYTYRVCEIDSGSCSNEATVSF